MNLAINNSSFLKIINNINSNSNKNINKKILLIQIKTMKTIECISKINNNSFSNIDCNNKDYNRK